MNEPDDFVEDALFARELAAALKRVAPPEDFAERVLARAASASAARGSGHVLTTMRQRLWLALAASLLFAALGWLAEQHREREVRRQVARAKFEWSMAITQNTLAGVGIETRKQLSAAGIQLEP